MPYQGLTSLDAAERLGTTPEEVYRLLFTGKIDGGPDGVGQVRFPEAEVERVAGLGLSLADPSSPRERPPLRKSGYEGLTSIEAAERLGIEPEAIYHLLFTGTIDGGPDIHGQVRFPESEVARLAEQGVPAT